MWVEIYKKTEPPVVINMETVTSLDRHGKGVCFRGTGKYYILEYFKDAPAAVVAVDTILDGLRLGKRLLVIDAETGKEIQ